MSAPRGPSALVLALASAALALPGVPGASAHCDHPSYQPPLDLVDFSTCPYNQQLEDLVDAANQANGGTMAFVLVKDKGFHPLQATVKSGGTVVFLYLDVEAKLAHDPRNSNVCANAVDPILDPEACVPSGATGKCFDIVDDLGDEESTVGDVYPVTLRYDGAGLAASKGFLSGTLPVLGFPPFAEPFGACAPNVSYRTSTQAVVPYHCARHGDADSPDVMRGVIVVGAAA